MAAYQTRPFKRGDIYYISYDGAFGTEMATGRPAIIITADEKCGGSPVLSVVYLTTREAHSEYPDCVEINSTNRKSWALCNQIISVDKLRCKNYCATASSEEMEAVDKVIADVLGIPYGIVNDTSAVDAVKAELAETEAELHKRDEKVFELMAERDYYKKLYDMALNHFAHERLNKDLSNPRPEFKRVPRIVPDEPEVVEPESLIDLNTCSVADLKKAGLKEDMIVRVIKARPFKKAEDLRGVQGMTRIAWQLLQHKVTVEEKRELDVPAPVEKVNVNTASGREIAKAMGVGESTGYTITGYRSKNGPFKSLDELMNVPRFTKSAYAKALASLIV